MPTYLNSKITSGVIQRMKPGETIMDTDEPGFGVRRQTGAPVFFVRKYANGQRHFETIGEFGTGGLTVKVARDKAARKIMAIRDGLSPALRRAREVAMPTIAQFAEQWLAAHVDPKLKVKTAAAYRSSLKSMILPTIGNIRVDHLDEKAVFGMHHKGRATPYAANRALAVMSKMMNFAERQGFRPKGTNPTKGIERYREHKRERFLSVAELSALGAALSDPDVMARHSMQALQAIALLLLTGMRLNEVLRLTWTEVDLERGLLLLSDSKTGKKPVVLGQAAIALIASFQRQSNDWVFPGASGDRPLYDLKKTWQTVRSTAGLTDLRIHDLRHTFASAAASGGGSLPMIGRLLGHTQAATTQRYAHLTENPVRELADQVSASIASSMTQHHNEPAPSKDASK